MYIINFIDRVNLGFAALSMNQELGITPMVFGFVSGIFFLGYILFEYPSNRMMERWGAKIWLPRILISWGTHGSPVPIRSKGEIWHSYSVRAGMLVSVTG